MKKAWPEQASAQGRQPQAFFAGSACRGKGARGLVCAGGGTRAGGVAKLPARRGIFVQGGGGRTFRKTSQLPLAGLKMFPKDFKSGPDALIHDAIQDFFRFLRATFFLRVLLSGGLRFFLEFRGAGFLPTGLEFLALRFRERGRKIIDLFFEVRSLRNGFFGLLVDPTGSHPRANAQQHGQYDKPGEHNAKNDFCGFGHAKVFL
ncbi:MAG: hypothetical protein LBP52_03700 [Burkholderiaceae bacterium]|jgi:hypothetical protein|nr:hypothetical protein [Burkholderiaceae bacterium]